MQDSGKSANPPLVSLVSLTWNSREYLAGLRRSVEELHRLVPLELFVVDNGSQDGTREELQRWREESPHPLETIFLERNFGTTYPRNLALKKVSGEFVVILDSDVAFSGAGFPQALEYLRRHPEVGILAPKLYLGDGEVQRSVKLFPTISYKLRQVLNIFKGVRSAPPQYHDFPFPDPRAVETAISAFWIIPVSVLEKVGLLDERIFYAPEDVDYCVRVWKAGLQVVYFPGFEVTHFTQQVSHQNPLGKIALTHFRDLLYFFHKHGYYLHPEKLRKQIAKLTQEEKS